MDLNQPKVGDCIEFSISAEIWMEPPSQSNTIKSINEDGTLQVAQIQRSKTKKTKKTKKTNTYSIIGFHFSLNPFERQSMKIRDIIKSYPQDVESFRKGGDMSEKLYESLYDYYFNSGEMPYGTAKCRTGDPHEFVETTFMTYILE